MSNPHAHDVWGSTVALLRRLSSSGQTPSLERVSRLENVRMAGRKNTPTRSGDPAMGSASFTVVERISERAILICWRDATLGHYAEQPWMKGIARRSTICVLSGLRIRRGDIVYRPCTRGKRCVNGEEVVLAVVVDGVAASIC